MFFRDSSKYNLKSQTNQFELIESTIEGKCAIEIALDQKAILRYSDVIMS